MVLEQKMSAMSEHNTQNAGNSDMSAHSKKMSLATKLKKQRKIRQAGSLSPVPNEEAMVGSKSPVRENANGNSKTDDYPAKSPPRGANTSAPVQAAPASSNANGSRSSNTGTSLLHNKRRAMHLAKSRRGQPAKSNAAASTAKSEPANTDKVSTSSVATNSSTNKNASSSSAGNTGDAYLPYFRKMPAAAAAAAAASSRPGLMEPTFSAAAAASSRTGLMEPAFSIPKTSMKQAANPNAASSTSKGAPDSHPQNVEHATGTKVSEPPTASMSTFWPAPEYPDDDSHDHDVTPVESAESEERQHYKEGANPTSILMARKPPSRPTTPVKTRDAPKVNPRRSPVSHQPPPMVHQQKETPDMPNLRPAPAVQQPKLIQPKPTPAFQQPWRSPVQHQPPPTSHEPKPTYVLQEPKPSSAVQQQPKQSPVVHQEYESAAPAVTPQQKVAPTTKKTTRPPALLPPPSSHNGYDEVVPWETEAPLSAVDRFDRDYDDSDKLSSVSIGRPSSVISNGVVDYDESIMSLARLDNFRSKANQDKANKVTVYPGVSGIQDLSSSATGDIKISGDQSEPNRDRETIPISSAKEAATQRWKSQVSEQRPSPARAQSWKAKSSTTTTASSIKQVGSRSSFVSVSKSSVTYTGRQQPSWVKSSGQVSTDEAPASPTPNNSNLHHPVSPARSAFSSTSHKHDRSPPPYFNMSKFSSSRSDVGVEPTPMMSAVRRDSTSTSRSWKASPAVKKATFAPNTTSPARQDEARAVSPTPSWHSLRSDQDHDSCPGSPSPSQNSEVESAGVKPASNPPKARVWSAKKQPPAWMKHRSPSPIVSISSRTSASPKRPSMSSSRMKPTTQESDAPELKPAAAPPKSAPSIPKPVNPRQTDGAERERVAKSPRRHSSPAPSWVKPIVAETNEAETKAEPSSIPKTKTWAVNKQTPSWMKKKNEEQGEKPPAPVPTTKTWPAKKQTPAWVKQPTKIEREAAPTPSPRRGSTPSWMKPGQQNLSELVSPQAAKETVVSGSPHTPGRSMLSPGTGNDGEASPSPARAKAKSRRKSSQGFMEQKPAASPRSQSWKAVSPPLHAENTTIARKARHSLGGEPSKMSAANFVKKQRSPSPSVAQLQEQIFVTKLGVSGDSADQPRVSKPQRGPSAPSPQVKQLQQIIFSPGKTKNQTQTAAESGGSNTSPAAGWWKRIPNAPEVQTEHYELPPWKHESSNGNAGEEQSDAAPPSPNKTSEPLPVTPAQKTWKRPASACTGGPGTPSFLKDVATYHQNSPTPKLPSEPPLWQQPSKPTPPLQQGDSRPKTPSGAPSESAGSTSPAPASSPRPQKSSSPAPASSPRHQELVDEGSSDLMMASSTSTTSRDDVGSGVQQEDTKSLIQMAADSVLIADYEQAMRRDAVDSKSDDEDESIGNSAGNALPNELPPEFQKALTSEEREEAKEKPEAQKSQETSQPSPAGQGFEEKKCEEECSPKDISGKPSKELTTQELKQPQVQKCASDPVMPTKANNGHRNLPSSASLPPEAIEKGASLSQASSKQSEDKPGEDNGGMVFGDPSTFGSAGGEPAKNKAKSKVAPNIAERAKAILGWAEKRTPNTHEEVQPVAEVVEVIHREPAPAPPAPLPHSSNSLPKKVIVHDEAEQDENGFPCAPFSEEHAQFDGDFPADAFGNQEWVATSEDEKKDASDILQYWAPEMDAMNDSSEWGHRDPDLDSVPMNSPGAVSAEQVILTAEKMLKKWSNLDSRQPEPRAPPVFTSEEKAPAETAREAWPPTTRSPPRSKDNLVSAQGNDPWDASQFAGQTHTTPSKSRSAEQQPAHDFMGPMASQQAHSDAAWTSPDRIGNTQAQQEGIAMWGLQGSEQPTLDATWGSPQPDPFSTSSGHFEMLSGGAKRPQEGDVFDPFGEEDDGVMNFQSGQLFSEPTDGFVAVEAFSPPQFAPVSDSKRYSNPTITPADVFDTYYQVPSQGYQGQSIPLKPVSKEMDEGES